MRDTLSLGVGMAGIGLCGFAIGVGLTISVSNIIPKAKAVQSGFAVPNKLEILLQDLDNNGEKETLLKYDGQSYLLLYGASMLYDKNMPKIVPYEVKPVEIIPKESELEIVMQDMDANGEKEVVLKYKGKTYLLLRDGKLPKFVLPEEKLESPKKE